MTRPTLPTPGLVTEANLWGTMLNDYLTAGGLGAFDVCAYGAVGDGVTDDTTAVNAAYAAAAVDGGIVTFPPGTFICECTFTETYRPVTFAGSGPGKTKGTILKAKTAGEPVFKFTGTAGYFPCSITGIQFHGSSKVTSGVEINGNITGRLYIHNCSFQECSTAFKSVGAIGNVLDMCHIVDCYYGVYITNGTSNNGALQVIRDCTITGAYYAGVYLDGDVSYMPTDVRIIGGTIEGCPGYGVFATDLGYSRPLYINSWVENCATGGTITVGGVTAAPKTFYFDDIGRVIMERVYIRDMKLASDTVLELIDCYGYDGAWDIDKDGTSVVKVRGFMPFSSKGLAFSGVTSGLVPVIGGSVYSNTRVPISDAVDFTRTNMVPKGSMSIPFTPTTVGGNTVTFVNDPTAPIYGTCLQVAFAAGSQAYTDGVRLTGASLSFKSGKWYVYSADVMSVGGDGEISVWFSGPSAGAYLNTVATRNGQWRRYMGCRLGSATAAKSVYIWNPGTGNPTFKVANLQCVEFGSVEDAEVFMRQNAFAADSTTQRLPSGEMSLLTKTVIKTIDVDDDASVDDYQFDDDAANTTQQVITLTNILPAYAELVSWQIRCFETVTGSATMGIKFGTSSGGEELMASANIDTAADIGASSAGAGPALAATNADRSIYFSATPGANWNTLNAGRWAVMLTYVDYAAAYNRDCPAPSSSISASPSTSPSASVSSSVSVSASPSASASA